MNKKKGYVKECCIDKIKNEINASDWALLERERNELYVNLIHFDLNMASPDNYKNYNKFKVDVVGGFLAMDDLEIFKKYLKELNKLNDIPFIVISSGSSGKDVIPICKQYPFVKEVIIFCGDYIHNEHYIKEHPGYVKKVYTNIKDIYEYIKTFGANIYKEGFKNFRNSGQFMFSYEQIQMDNQLEQCPIISAYEYDNCYFIIHKADAQFFENINDRNENVTFTKENYKKIEELINNSTIIKNIHKSELLEKFKRLVNAQNFVELSIRTYTGESNFCYIFNRIMRNFEHGLISLTYFMGPLLYGLNKYVKENPQNFGFSKDMTLYRYIKCPVYDFYLYKLNLNHIICFPSLTSTRAIPKVFKQTKKCKDINKNDFSSGDMIDLTMIFKYKHEPGNISPGIIIKDHLGSDGKHISSHPTENEVILFPFTFARITNIEPMKKNTYTIELDIINRKEYIEYKLKNDVENRFSFSGLD